MRFRNSSNSPIDIMLEPYARLYTIDPGYVVEIIDKSGNNFSGIDIVFAEDGIDIDEIDGKIEIRIEGKIMDCWTKPNTP